MNYLPLKEHILILKYINHTKVMVEQILTNRGEVAMIFKLKALLILFISLMVFVSCKRETNTYKVDDIRLIHQEVIEREYRQSGKRILREQRRKTYSDTIRIYKVVLSNDNISKTIELNHKSNFNVGDIINYY